MTLFRLSETPTDFDRRPAPVKRFVPLTPLRFPITLDTPAPRRLNVFTLRSRASEWILFWPRYVFSSVNVAARRYAARSFPPPPSRPRRRAPIAPPNFWPSMRLPENGLFFSEQRVAHLLTACEPGVLSSGKFKRSPTRATFFIFFPPRRVWGGNWHSDAYVRPLGFL